MDARIKDFGVTMAVKTRGAYTPTQGRNRFDRVPSVRGAISSAVSPHPRGMP